MVSFHRTALGLGHTSELKIVAGRFFELFGRDTSVVVLSVLCLGV